MLLAKHVSEAAHRLFAGRARPAGFLLECTHDRRSEAEYEIQFERLPLRPKRQQVAEGECEICPYCYHILGNRRRGQLPPGANEICRVAPPLSAMLAYTR